MTLYRCHVGHGYTEATLRAGQEDVVEFHLWESIRALEEHAEIHRGMASRRGLPTQRVRDLKRQSKEMAERALILRRILVEQRTEPPMKGAPAKTPKGRRGGKGSRSGTGEATS
jgi:two-component system chemotaxis response regulator CheB